MLIICSYVQAYLLHVVQAEKDGFLAAATADVIRKSVLSRSCGISRVLRLWPLGGSPIALTGRRFIRVRGVRREYGWTSTVFCLSVHHMHFCRMVVHLEGRTPFFGLPWCFRQKDGIDDLIGTDAIGLALGDGKVGLEALAMHLFVWMHGQYQGPSQQWCGSTRDRLEPFPPVLRSPRSEGNRIPFPRMVPMSSVSFVYRRGTLGFVPCKS